MIGPFAGQGWSFVGLNLGPLTLTVVLRSSSWSWPIFNCAGGTWIVRIGPVLFSWWSGH